MIDREGPERIPYVCLAGTVNMAGGQPISMASMRAVRELTTAYGIRVILDATRLAENAYFIQMREPGYQDRPIADIHHEFCSYSDGATMSAKKDSLVNIGGWLAMNDPALFEEACSLVMPAVRSRGRAFDPDRDLSPRSRRPAGCPGIRVGMIS